ncbi:MAG: universal stress protein [Thermoleophilia bacterium]|nr:universal stress protein [Thermoleophilia bacterium]
MFDRMIVATDGSASARTAVKHASELARLAGTSEVLIIHVCPACSVDLDPDEVNRRLASGIVDEAAKAFEGAEAGVRTMIDVDYPPESLGSAIVEIAKRENADLIVLGSRGLSEFRGMLLGSVSSKVVQHASCPVLIVKQPEAS